MLNKEHCAVAMNSAPWGYPSRPAQRSPSLTPVIFLTFLLYLLGRLTHSGQCLSDSGSWLISDSVFGLHPRFGTLPVHPSWTPGLLRTDRCSFSFSSPTGFPASPGSQVHVLLNPAASQLRGGNLARPQRSEAIHSRTQGQVRMDSLWEPPLSLLCPQDRPVTVLFFPGF